MIRKIATTLILCLAIFVIAPDTVTAAGLKVGSAKSQGLVGEKPNGLLGAVSASPSANVSTLVKTTNAARLKKYRSVAQSNGLTLDQVKTLAGTKLTREAPKGQYIFKNGKWVKR